MGLLKKKPLTEQQIAGAVAKDIDRIRAKYGCELGVWLNFDWLLINVDNMYKNPEVKELMFPLQIRIENGTKTNDKVSPDDEVSA